MTQRDSDTLTLSGDRSGILDHEVLAAARFCAAAGATDVLEALGIHARARSLAAPFVGRTGWLKPLIAELKPVGYLELKTKRRR